jgi:hypothetical protein
MPDKDFVKVGASLLPKGLELDLSATGMSPELRAELTQFARDFRLVKAAMQNIGVDKTLLIEVENGE